MRGTKRLSAGILLAITGMFVLATSGADCDSNAQDAFRETAAGPIGNGVKSIVDGMLDGWVAAVQSTTSESDASSASKVAR